MTLKDKLEIGLKKDAGVVQPVNPPEGEQEAIGRAEEQEEFTLDED